MINDEEVELINSVMNKLNRQNKSKLIREIIFPILKELNQYDKSKRSECVNMNIIIDYNEKNEDVDKGHQTKIPKLRPPIEYKQFIFGKIK